MKRPVRWLSILSLIVLVACGGGETEPDVGRADNQESLTIEEPVDRAEVQAPFTVSFSSSNELGTVESGASHVHLWIDGNEEEYEVIEGDSFEIRKLAPGEHTITVSLRNSDHSATGAGDEITITVTKAS